jgi:hypothetical protein
MKRVIMITSLVFAVMLLVTAAMAQPGAGRQGREGRQDGERPDRPPVIFGVITEIGNGELTIRPEIPEQMRERMKENGREMPDLPESITMTYGEKTKWIFEGEAGSVKDFKTGDQVVVRVVAVPGADGPAAGIVSDPKSARDFMQKMRKNRQGGGEEDGPGMGPGGGPGMGMGPGEGMGMGPQGMGPGAGAGKGQRGERRERPAFGTILKISADSVTIKPEIPEFMQKAMKERGRELPDLPKKLTFALATDMKVMKDGKVVKNGGFEKGDKVVLRLGPGDGEQPVVVMMCDAASAKQLMEKRMEKKSQGNGKKSGTKKGAKAKTK